MILDAIMSENPKAKLPTDLAILKVQNVADYVRSLKKEDWDIRTDFPNLAPPWPAIWYEWKCREPRPDQDPNECVGIINSSTGERTYPSLGILQFATQMKPSESEMLSLDDSAPKWVVQTICSLVRNSPLLKQFSPRGPSFGGSLYFVTAEGKMFLPPSDSEIHNQFMHDVLTREGLKPNSSDIVKDGPFFLRYAVDTYDDPKTVNWIAGVIDPVVLLTQCLLHCKNLVLRTQQVKPRHGRSRLHSAGLKFHELEITPVKQVLASAGVSKTGLKMALHICRGHFKDFSYGSGLFGKHKGLYWWNMQARGAREQGQITKNYQINRP